MNLVARDTFAKQVAFRFFRRNQQHVRQLIGHQTIDLFRHRTIIGPQTRFHVSDLRPQLRANQRCRDRRIHVAVHQNHIGLALENRSFKADHDFSRLHGVRTRPDFERNIRTRNLQLFEKDVRQVLDILRQVKSGHPV